MNPLQAIENMEHMVRNMTSLHYKGWNQNKTRQQNKIIIAATMIIQKIHYLFRR